MTAARCVLAGRAPSHVADNWRGDHPEPVLYEEGRGMRFEARVRLETDGVAEADGERLIVRGASRLTAVYRRGHGVRGLAHAAG